MKLKPLIFQKPRRNNEENIDINDSKGNNEKKIEPNLEQQLVDNTEEGTVDTPSVENSMEQESKYSPEIYENSDENILENNEIETPEQEEPSVEELRALAKKRAKMNQIDAGLTAAVNWLGYSKSDTTIYGDVLEVYSGSYYWIVKAYVGREMKTIIVNDMYQHNRSFWVKESCSGCKKIDPADSHVRFEGKEVAEYLGVNFIN